MAERHPTDKLSPILVRYLAWGISTCSCERDFSKTLKLRGGQCEDQYTTREEDVLMLQADNDPAEHDDIIKGAMRVWSLTYGDVRSERSGCSIRTGIPQRQGHGKGEAAFLRIRREAMDTLMASSSQQPPPLAIDADAITFNDKQAREAAERKKKLRKRQIDALKAGHLNDDEVDEELLLASIENIKKDRVANMNTAAEKRRKLQLVQKAEHDLSDATVYVTSHIPLPDGLRQAMNPLADYIICANPADPHLVLKFAACLHGSSICTREFVQGGHVGGGPCISYWSAIGVKRHVHITDAFMAEQAEMAQLICASIPQGLWLLATVDELNNIVRGQAAKQRLAFVFMGAAESEATLHTLDGLTNKFTAQSCFESLLFCKIDRARSWLGACGI